MTRTERLDLTLTKDGVPFELPAGASVALKLKPVGEYEAAPLQVVTLTSAQWIPSARLYRKTFSLVTAPVLALLAVDEEEGNDEPKVDVMAVFVYLPTGDADEEVSDEFPLVIRNSVSQDSDVEPDDVPGPDDFLGARALRYDSAQSLTNGQRIQAQQNAGFTLNEAGELVVITASGPKRIVLLD